MGKSEGLASTLKSDCLGERRREKCKRGETGEERKKAALHMFVRDRRPPRNIP